MTGYTYQSWSLDAPVGPIDDEDEVECAYGGPTLPTDPELVYITGCDRDAVARIPWSRDVLGTIAVCDFHLGRYLEAFPDRADRLSKIFDVDELVPDRMILSLESVSLTREIGRANRDEIAKYHVIGLDQRGHVHYYNENYKTVVRVEEFGHDGVLEDLTETTFPDYMETIRDLYGWAEFADELQKPTDGGRSEP